MKPDLKRIVLCAVSFILCFFTASALAGEEVTFTYVPPVAGDKKIVQSDETGHWKQKITNDHGEIIENARHFELSRTTVNHTILEADGDTVKKLELKYGTAVLSESEKDVDVPASPVFGKTYIAEFKGGEIVVTDAQGKTPGDKELQIVRKEARPLGTPNYFGRFMNGKRMKLKEKLDVPKSLLEDLSKDTGRWKYESMEMTLISIDTLGNRECAVFDVQYVMTSNYWGDAVLKMECKGKAVLDTAICRPVSHAVEAATVFKGPVDVNGLKFEMDIESKMQGHESARFENLRK